MASTLGKVGKTGENDGEAHAFAQDAKYDINNDENYKRLKEDKKRLKKDLMVKDSEINSLKKILEERDKDTRVNHISLNEARKITYKALKKGSAAQKFIHLLESNSINLKLKKKAMNQLAIHAFGDLYPQRNRCTDILKYTDSHLKLFRQEQLILLAENERLTSQMKELKKQLLDNKIDILKRNEINLITSMKRSSKEKNNKSACIDNKKDENYIELDADVVEKNFINLIKNFKIAQLKLLYYAFRKISNNMYHNSDIVHINASIVSSLKESTETLNNIMKNKMFLNVCTTFYKLLSYHENNFIYNNRKYSQLGNVNHYTNRNCTTLKKKETHGISNFVFKPYYYDTLPSATYDMKDRHVSIQRKKNTIMRNFPIDNFPQMGRNTNLCAYAYPYEGEQTYFDPSFSENKVNTVTTGLPKICKNSYFDFGKNNDKQDKFSSFSDLDYLAELGPYDREKFIDMFISDAGRRGG
ncbi:conserved Plasmodium protein, unknown function [Plasmodium ovale wallikeri]|uniref:Uncharacterized protein n=2 Tax=Plasmodium ovale TaxID=36330 RepID=A0A1A9AHR0_PLAOA|nr:conserved Plasmodium protein, unknown function [Plasmodium ovale wallikeri]SBT55698.1 conserved Plasmodium protein, unknown function [Plasmodium ovale wallikeri]SBT78439.1 conserved Plasmodium protein, unknown function [Plasmodium ovale]